MDNYRLLQEQHDRYVYCRDSGHLKYQEKARKCEDFFAGKQWDESTKRALAQVRRPALTLNKTLSSLMVLFAAQLKNRASISFIPSSGDAGQETATALNKLWLHTASVNRFKWVESQVFDDAVITGRGYFDIRMQFAHHMLGDVQISHINPLNVLVDPDSEEYDPDKWSDIFYSKWLCIEDIQRLYGKGKAEKVRRNSATDFPMGYDYFDERPDTFGGYEALRPSMAVIGSSDDLSDYRKRVRVLERQYKKVEMQEHFVDMETGDMSVIPEGMAREKIQAIQGEYNVNIIKRPTDVYWWTVTAGDTVLHHSESPYKHFTIVPFFPVFRRGATIGMVENLIDPQELYNKARSQELHVINTSANSGWITQRGAVLNLTTEELEERGAESGLVLEVDHVDSIKKITPNPIPTGLDRVSQVAGDDLKEISMASDSMRGFDREDVAAKAIQAKQQVGGENFAKIMDNLAHTRTMVAYRALDLMQTFYTTQREFQITGAGLNAQTEQLVINQPPQEQEQPQEQPQEQEPPPEPPKSVLNDITKGKYAVTVTTIPDRDTMQQTNMEQAIQLRELGVPIPDTVLIENSSLENKEELLEEKPDPITEQNTQLDLATKEEEVNKLKAEVEKLKSDAALNLVRASRDAADTQLKQAEAEAPPEAQSQAGAPAQQGPDLAAIRSQQGDMDLKRMELRMKDTQMKDDLALKQKELSLKQVEMKVKAALEMKKLMLAEEQKKEKPTGAKTGAKT